MVTITVLYCWGTIRSVECLGYICTYKAQCWKIMAIVPRGRKGLFFTQKKAKELIITDV